jgi:DNA-binding MarR family transcriptional regulator
MATNDANATETVESERKGERQLDMGVLSQSIGYHLRRAQLRVFEHFATSFAELDLRPGQFSVLVVVDRNPGLRQSEVAAALGIQRTNFVPLVDELERRGLIERRASPIDRRSYALHLTPQGEELLGAALSRQQKHEDEWAVRAGAPSRAALVQMLQRLADPY